MSEEAGQKQEAMWFPERVGKTYRVQKDLGNGKVRCVMRPGVGDFKSRHQRVYMTLSGAQEIADALNACDAEKRGKR